MKITKPFKHPTSVRLTKDQKKRILALSPNVSYYIQRAVEEQLKRDENCAGLLELKSRLNNLILKVLQEKQSDE